MADYSKFKMRVVDEEYLLHELKEAIRGAKMENAKFDNDGKDVSNFIRERTRLYRNSWIIAPLERILAKTRGR